MFKRVLAQEAIAHQHNSKLFSGVTTLCQDLLDYVDSEAKAMGLQAGKIRSGSAQALLRKFSAYFNSSKAEQKFKDIVKRECGVEVTEFGLEGGAGPNAYAGFSLNVEGRDRYHTNVGSHRASGLGDEHDASLLMNYRFTKITDASEETFMRMKKGFDRDSSRVAESLVGSYQSMIYVTAITFIMKWLYPELTPTIGAEEISATILHEIGHVFYYIEMCHCQYRVSAIIDDVVESQKTPIPMNQIVAAASNMRAQLSLLSKSPTKDLKAIQKALDRYLSDTKDHATDLSEDECTSGEFLINKAVGYVAVNLAIKKLSDLGSSPNDRAIEERSADEFSARHGGGPASARYEVATGKFYANWPALMNRRYNDQSRLTIMRALALTSMWSVFMHRSSVEIRSSYDPNDVRLEQYVVQLNIALADRTLPDDLRKQYIIQHDEAAALVKQWNELDFVKYRRVMFGLIDRIQSVGPLGFKSWSEQETRNNKVIQDAIAGLTRSDLHYWESVFKIMRTGN